MAHPVVHVHTEAALPSPGTEPARPIPDRGLVHVWRIPLAGPPADAALAAAARVLGAGERVRAERLRLDADRRRWTAARVALRTVLSWYTGMRPDLITLAYGRHGKPRLAGRPPGGLRFSLSHSHDRALLAVCRGVPVGVDLEHPSAGPADGRDLDDLAAAVLAPAELHSYLGLPAARRRAALLRRWTGKEAVLKATGRGVTLSAARRLVVPEGTGSPSGLPGQWTLLRPCQDDGYTAAVCVLGKDWNVVCTDFTGLTPEDRPPTGRGWTPHGPALSRSGGPAARHG
ncbi:4'-phosphopantetheinyl transferase superfamily protein [Streptomyces sp. NPDC010273]|uniref:4'-phosphopantetheinyl transferase family protein n=1 Tax=Streptomyces sp. NPDC010273 TaxID=3364829 RepID=UPI0036E2622F